MTESIGVDIIEIDRVAEIISEFGEKFLKKVFSDEEIRYCLSKAKPSQHFAARFAAKEAVIKALGTGFGKGIMLKDIEIRNDVNGKPKVFYKGNSTEKILISISHCNHYVVAFALLKID